ncbi:hypothetical protein RHS01_09821 [Rhizoctonia solani]|uniref:Alpha/beta-hydrolase n=1 Tax=Rhizoctonia solani TaxID=456999 RepID=A0A8H7M159_9AGAM|nr:hypothetical protein RHS01_09821 [Rhizoctonia solani]
MSWPVSQHYEYILLPAYFPIAGIDEDCLSSTFGPKYFSSQERSALATAFGGDPKRMIAFGQSAGSISAGYLPFAYPKNPIVTGIGEISASTLIPDTTIIMPEFAQGNFTDLASDCSWKARKNPSFNGQLDNEADSLIPSSPSGIDQATSDAFGHFLLVCPAAKEAQLRVDAGSELSDTATLASTLTLPPTPLFAVIIPRIYLCGLAQLTRFQGSRKRLLPGRRNSLRTCKGLWRRQQGQDLGSFGPRNSSELVVFENPAEFDAPCAPT